SPPANRFCGAGGLTLRCLENLRSVNGPLPRRLQSLRQFAFGRRSEQITPRVFSSLFCEGQVEREGRALVRCTIHLDIAPRLTHEPIHLAEPQTRSLADFFGCEEGLEDLGKYFRV